MSQTQPGTPCVCDGGHVDCARKDTGEKQVLTPFGDWDMSITREPPTADSGSTKPAPTVAGPTTSHLNELSQKRRRASSESSGQLRRSDRCKMPKLISSPQIQGWVVRGLEKVILCADGSAQCSLRWEDTVVNEIELEDPALQDQFMKEFKRQHGEDKWIRWVNRGGAKRAKRYYYS